MILRTPAPGWPVRAVPLPWGRARCPPRAVRLVLIGALSGGELLVLLLAGIGAGLVGSVAGLASLISYPALLAVGLSPVTANVTNTVSLVFSGLGSALGSRVELAGQRARLQRLGPAAALGGAVGCALLLVTPADAFEAAVPVLIAVASLMVLAAPAPSELAEHVVDAGRWLTVGIFLIGIYGGYFGAAAGVMMLASLMLSTNETVVRSIATKNVLLGFSNGVAAVGFVLLADVDWAAVVPLAVGFLLGGRVGPAVTRRAPVKLLRLLIGLAGLSLAAHLALQTYG